MFARRFPRAHATFTRYASSRAGQVAASTWARRRPIFIGLFVTYGVINYAIVRREAYLRDYIHPDSWLVLKVYPGAIVEAKTAPSLTALLNSPSAGEDMPRVMELFELSRALRHAAKDARIKGIFADFSSIHIPSSVTPEPLGMAQMEELVEAIHDFRLSKREEHYLKRGISKIGDSSSIEELVKAAEDSESGKEKAAQIEAATGIDSAHVKKVASAAQQAVETMDIKGEDLKKKMKAMTAGADSQDVSKEGKADALTEPNHDSHDSPNNAADDDDAPVTTIAWADSFESQGSFLLASAFDHVYLQPSGSVPLMGVRFQLPFFKRALDWLGINVYAEARREFKSMISQFTQADGLPPAQIEDESRLLGELGRSLSYTIGINRFPHLHPDEAADKVMELSRQGPFAAKEAAEAGLITGIKYKRDVIKMLGEEPQLRTMASYSHIVDRDLERGLSDDEKARVAVVYLRGTISNAPGEFSASTVIKGLKEAGEDPDVSSVVLRIDSGGGDAITSDSIWEAVTRVREDCGKPVVASFGNMSASGGYFAAAGADAILACESTITGSIGVASLRPTFTKKFFERIGVRLQTLFTGTNVMSGVHELKPEEKERWSRHIDVTYSQFLDKVCDGRKISRDVIEELAGGRVWTGLSAYVHCNPDQELARADGQDSAKIEPIDEESTKAGDGSEPASSAEKQPLKEKMATLLREWQANDVTREGEMSTLRITSLPGASPPKLSSKEPSSNSATEHEDDEETATAARELAEVLESTAKEEEKDTTRRGTCQPEAAAPKDSQDGAQSANTEDEDESRLAVAAHEAAEASHSEDNAKRDGSADEDKAEEEQLGPYGRGLVDAIGGLYDAGVLALSMGLQQEVNTLIQEGMTPEQAADAVRPGAKREVGADGNLALTTDLKLVRYPKEKGFRERVRELNRRGDEPSLSLFFPGLNTLGTQLQTFFSDAAVQLLVRSWSDPAFVQRVTSTLEREQQRNAVRMERAHSVHL